MTTPSESGSDCRIGLKNSECAAENPLNKASDGKPVGLEAAKIATHGLRRVFQAGFRGLRHGARGVLLAYQMLKPTHLPMPHVKHYGCFQFKAHITETRIAECFQAMAGMVGRIPGLLDFHWGPYDSAEGLNDGYTHGFIMTFASPQARDEYLPHPVHEEVKAIVVPCLERVVVFDFNLTA